MKKPLVSPKLADLMAEVLEDHSKEKLFRIYQLSSAFLQEPRYLHWDKLRRIPPPEGLTHRDWLVILKMRRLLGRRQTPLQSTNGEPFWFCVTDKMSEFLRDIDSRASGSIGVEDPMLNPDQKDRYLVNSLVAEAVTSSQLEGAATTREVAKEMIRTSRPPRDIHERMILNNFQAMQHVGGLRSKPLDRNMILELHRILTAETLDDPADVGRFRLVDQYVDVRNIQNEVFHVPPPVNELEGRLEAMCEFANGKTPNYFVHPVVRSIILHFWLAYDHPFVDGNGRTARALFYWSMLRHGYWLCEYISISEIIRKAPARYGRAFLYTETDENDLTYFLLYHLEVVRRAIDQLHACVQRKTAEIQLVERRMRVVSQLNPRQQVLISHALRHPRQTYTVESHRMSHNVVYQTARTDLLDLVKRGLLDSYKRGREWRFTPVANLEERLQ